MVRIEARKSTAPTNPMAIRTRRPGSREAAATGAVGVDGWAGGPAEWSPRSRHFRFAIRESLHAFSRHGRPDRNHGSTDVGSQAGRGLPAGPIRRWPTCCVRVLALPCYGEGLEDLPRPRLEFLLSPRRRLPGDPANSFGGLQVLPLGEAGHAGGPRDVIHRSGDHHRAARGAADDWTWRRHQDDRLHPLVVA